jgi:hypothetical protein
MPIPSFMLLRHWLSGKMRKLSSSSGSAHFNGNRKLELQNTKGLYIKKKLKASKYLN